MGMMMIKSNINHSHFLLVGFLFLVAYPLCISGAAFPHAYGLHQIDRSTPALTPSYRIRFMNRTSFPTDFVFGAASSAYQIEGAWNESGKGPSNWDNFTHQYPGKILNNSNGDVACNSYNLYKDDVSLLKNMSLDSYRFSIAWSRVIPNKIITSGRRSDGVNEEGITYYQNLIDELHNNSIEPSITLFHWDVPQGLEDEYGGFLSPNIVDDFRDFADLCFERFGPKVKSWITLNEPWSFSTSGYDSGGFAPGRCSSWIDPTCTGGNSSTEPYITAHYQLLAHSAAVKLYRERYQASQNGKIGPTLVSTWMVPYSKNDSDVRAAARALEFMLGWFMDPVVFGRYPRSMRRLVGDRLPTFNATESSELRGSFDFVGINYYTAFFVVDTSDEPYTTNLRYTSDYRANLTYVGPDGNLIGVQAGSTWLHIYPVGIWKLLTYIRLKYNNPIVYVTENGVDEVNNATLPLQVALQDNFRVVYYYQHLAHVLKAIHEGANVAGYYAWSIMDNFEWAAGYSVRFGVNYVDFEDGFKRYAKLSARWFNRFLSK